MANTTVCLPHHDIQCFAVKLSEGNHQDASCGGRICISFSHKFACVWSLHTCVQIQGNKQGVVCG